MAAFLLGLSNGAVCLAYCAPLLIPYLLARNEGVRRSTLVVVRFLLGRLLGYLLFGLISFVMGRLLLQAESARQLAIGCAYLVFSVLLVLYAFFGPGRCCTPISRMHFSNRLSPFLVPVVGGLVTGLNFCPPFLLALVQGTQETTMLQNMLFFAAFFAGTSIFFIVLPLVGFLRASSSLRVIGKMASVIIGFYYLYSGIMLVAGGVRSL